MSVPEVELCSRCKVDPAEVHSRKEAFCKSCFLRFISGKQRKQMSNEKYKIKFGENVTSEKVLFPISFGQSSLVLFDILISMYDEQLQNKRGKLGFEIDVLFIDDSSVEKYDKSYQEIVKSIRESYEMTKYPIKFTRVDLDSFLSDKKGNSLHKVTLLKDFTSFKYLAQDDELTVEKLFKSCPNRASKHDLKQIILNDLINRYAYAKDIQSIIYGNNMNTLAEQVISLTVKGRGSEIYSGLTDGIKSIYGKEIEIINPLRDVSSREIALFSEFRNLIRFQIDETLDKYDKIMNKQKTINEVVSKYFKAVDTDYDNIVSTVVKTGAKLTEPKRFDDEYCAVCNGKIYNRPMEWLRDITYNGSRGPENEIEEESLQEWKDANSEFLTFIEKVEKDAISICYGCAVTVGGNTDNSVVWPVRDTTEEEDKQQILDDFIIGDEDSDDDHE
jgi:cytoplasmic tRNA 2-thiolation protein 2